MQHNDSVNTKELDEKRASLFTVQDVEEAILYFTYMTVLYPLVIIAHEIYHGWKGGWETTYLILRNVPIFFGIATTLILFKEGVDIMLRRWQEAREISRQKRAAIVEAARAEGRAEGIAEGRAEGIVEGKAEGIAEGRVEGIAEGRVEGIAEGKAEAQRSWNEWYRRQAEAREKGQPFTEPPPTLNGDTLDE